MCKISRSHDWRIFNLEVSHRICLFSYISKYRNYIEIKVLFIYTANKFIIIYPYISCSILAWGSVYKTHIKKIQAKQNHTVRLIFSHSWHNGLLPEVFDNTFQYARNIHRYNTRYTAKQNFYNIIKFKLMQGSNQFLTCQLISGKTSHLL